MPARFARLAVLIVLVVLGLAACTAEAHKGELIYGVTALDGSPAAESDVRLTATELELRLEEAGYTRREVMPMGPDRIRVVLPENVVGEIPKIRGIIEEPNGLRLALTLEPR